MKLTYIYTSLLFSLILTNCVSVELPKNSSKKAQNITFQIPKSDFEELKADENKTIDKAWISKKTGNIISFNSECFSKVELTLKQIETETLMSLGDLKILSSRDQNYNNREALVTTAEGSVDGVSVMLQILTFKKNECNFTLLYSGISKKYEINLSDFTVFVESFKVQ